MEIVVRGQQFVRTELLCIQEIDVPTVQMLTAEGGIDRNEIADADFIRLAFYFQPGLLVELRRIGKPDDNGVGIGKLVRRTEEKLLEQRSHNNGLSGTGRRGKRYDLWVILRPHQVSVFDFLVQVGERRVLEGE